MTVIYKKNQKEISYTLYYCILYNLFEKDHKVCIIYTYYEDCVVLL